MKNKKSIKGINEISEGIITSFDSISKAGILKLQTGEALNFSFTNNDIPLQKGEYLTFTKTPRKTGILETISEEKIYELIKEFTCCQNDGNFLDWNFSNYIEESFDFFSDYLYWLFDLPLDSIESIDELNSQQFEDYQKLKNTEFIVINSEFYIITSINEGNNEN